MNTVSARSTSGGIFLLETDDLIVGDAGVTVQRVGANAGVTPTTDATQSDVRTTADNGAIVLRTTDGSITLNEGTAPAGNTAVVTHGSGNVLLQAQGTNQDIAVNADVLSTSGNISVLATRNIDTAVTVDIATGDTGTIDVEATAGSVTMADNSRITTEEGDIRVLAGQDIAVAGIATDGAAGSVSLTATAGSITDAGDTNVDVVANQLRMVAGVGIGAGNALETTVNTVSARAAGGGIFLLETDDLIVGDTAVTVQRVGADATSGDLTDATQSDVRTTGDNGSIVLQTTNGSITLDDGSAAAIGGDDGNSVVAHGSGNVLIQAVAGTVTGNADIRSGTGHITVKADNDIALNADVNVTTGTPGTVSLDAEDGALTMAGSAAVTATGSSARVAAQNDITLGNVSAADISIISQAGAVINATDSTKNVTGTNLRLAAAESIGASDRHLTTATDRVTARSTSGDIFITEDDGLRIDAVTVTVTEVQPDAGTSDIEDVSQSALVSQGGNGEVRLQVLSGDLVQDSENGNIATTGTGEIHVTVVVGSIEMEDGAVTETTDGTITYEAEVNITVGELISATGAVDITATTGSILAQQTLDANRGLRETPVSEITTTGVIDLRAGSTIGRGEPSSDTDPDPVDGPFQIKTGHTAVNVLNAPEGVWLEGVGGEIVIGDIIGDVGPVTLTVFDNLAFIRLTKTVITDGQDIVFGRPVRVDESGITVSTGPGGGHIDFTATLDSLSGEGNDLTLTAGTGDVFFRAAVGRDGSGFTGDGVAGFNEPAMGSITISSADNVLIGAGMTTRVGTGSSTADLAITLSGTLTIIDTDGDEDTDTFDVDLGGSFTQTDSGEDATVEIQGDIRTGVNADPDPPIEGTVSFDAPITLTGHVRIDTDGDSSDTGATVTFANSATIAGNGSTEDGETGGPWDLRINAPAATVSFGQNAGAENGRLGGEDGVSRLRDIQIDDAQEMTFNGEVFARSFTQLAATEDTGQTTFERAQDYRIANSGFSFAGHGLTINDELSLIGGMSVANAGPFETKAANGGDPRRGEIIADGGVAQTGDGVNSIGADIKTDGTDIEVTTAITLTDGITMTTVDGAGEGNIYLTGAVDGTSEGGQPLTLLAGAGEISVQGAIGAATELATLIIDAMSVTLSGIGDSSQPGVAGDVNVDARERITLAGSDVTYWTGGRQRYDVPDAGIGTILAVENTGSNQTLIRSGAGEDDGTILFRDLYIDSPDAQIVFQHESSAKISLRNLFFYRGTVDLGTHNVTLATDRFGGGPGAGDVAIFGEFYDGEDPDRAPDVPNNNFFAYPGFDLLYGGSDPAYTPGNAGYTVATGVFGTDPAGNWAAFADLTGSTITVTGNFYVNGAGMTVSDPAGETWTLTIQDNSSADMISPAPNPRFGSPYAVAFNMEVSGSQAAGGTVSAAAGLPAGPPGLPSPYADEHNNGVQDSGGTANWVFSRPQITAAYTISDRVVRIEFSEPLANQNDEIRIAIEGNDALTYADAGTPADPGGTGGTRIFAEAYRAPAGHVVGDPLDESLLNASNTTTGAGNLDVIYVRLDASSEAVHEALRWKTDASGSASPDDPVNAGAGGADSTDRVGNDALDNIPDLFFLKGAFHGAEGRTPARNYGHNAFDRYDQTRDRAGPVLYRVEYGRAVHNNPAIHPYDAHNYFQLSYSEPVNFGDSAGLTIDDRTANNLQSNTTFEESGQRGGDIVTAGEGRASVVGYFDYDAGGSREMERGSRPGTVSDGEANALYRHDEDNPLPRPEHQLRIFLSGYLNGAIGSGLFPGWHADVPDPGADGATIEVQENAFIEDALGNQVNHLIHPPGFTAGPDNDEFLPEWDVDPPRFSTFNVSGDDLVFEIVAITDPVTNLINRLEFHVLDNSRIDFAGTHPEAVPEAERWDPRDEGKTDSQGFPLTHTNTRPHEGIRESTWNREAFTIGEAGSETFPVVPLEMVRDVNNSLFGEGINIRDDSYFALRIPEGGGDNRNWGLLTDLEVRYNHTEAFTTDLAGNLLPSFGFDGVPPMRVIQRVPPRMQLVLGRAGGRDLYVKFNEPVIGPDNDQITRQAFRVRREGGDWETPAGLEVVRSGDGNSVWEVLLRLAEPALGANDFFAGRIAPSGTPEHPIRDRSGNAMPQEDTRRLSDLLLGVVEPLWATDSLGINDAGQGGFRTLREFDGHQELSRTDITLQARLHTEPPYEGIPLRLIVDADVPSSRKWGPEGATGRFWMPELLPGLIDPGVEGGVPPHSGAMEIVPYDVDGGLRTFRIPGSSGPVSSGQELEFLFRAGGVGAARLLNPEDLLSLAPWRIALGTGFIAQRANVTILNNVIYPEAGESTVLVYELSRPGMVTVQVFSLDGSLIRTLQRGRQGRGTFRLAWDGRNNSNQIVARGIYFIRVVAPGVDEYRKVLIAK
ncbi:FlgD immunoglobulin-like domain containing protein [Alkalispirochaeta americana]|uniref:FlgD immunoglobulin-like domain containing protein n=1 Tax=Alkalispirochaeta americana TaxID=159291 RepID=UPI001F2E0EE4|nr:FlgD immunoglobulin-like domain containing protein [Alkalispirochaeta americana]